ncbi:hypothetical protein P389DRAFT_166328 [Cystobasidium minutum MCA 4210]|uniref:uncharacterized protein n=1 Tax=Cystobasidium minutum MCA 4210 TaxID=1397322 RepID=UPI0034CEB2A1|eukprot:jgi/Rhomi1/166328/fgenesh1_kg.1_\
MAPRKRAVPAAQDGNAAATAGRSNGGTRRAASSDDDEDNEKSPSALDILTACTSYTSRLEEENKQKSRKWTNEARKIADEYRKKTEALILEEQQEIKKAYDTYRADNDADLQEKERILKGIAGNLEEIEDMATLVAQRNQTRERSRLKETATALQTAENQRAAAAAEVAHALKAKRNEVHERVTEAGDLNFQHNTHSKL